MHLEHQHSLKEALSEMVSTMKWEGKLHDAKVKLLWSEKMGTTINQYTKEIALSSKGKLFIAITSASLKQELSYEKEKIMEMMNHAFGAEVVKSVIIR